MRRVLIAGPLRPYPGAEFHAQLLRSWARALIKQGVECSLVQFGQIEHWMGSGVGSARSDSFFMLRRHVPWFDVTVERAETDIVCRHIESFRPDCTVIAASWPQTPVETTRRLRDAGSGPLFGWLGAPPLRAARNGRLLEFMAQLDVVLVYDPASEPCLRQAGVKDVRVLPLSADVDAIHKAIGVSGARRTVPIGFCGRVDGDRLPYLDALADLGLTIWTNSQVPSNLKRCTSPPVVGPDMYRALARCKIGLNIHNGFELSGGNSRTYEVPACGAVLLCDDKPAVREAFADGVEAVLVNSPRAARAAAQRLLADDGERQVIGAKGQARIAVCHSVDARVATLMEWMGECAAWT